MDFRKISTTFITLALNLSNWFERRPRILEPRFVRNTKLKQKIADLLTSEQWDVFMHLFLSLRVRPVTGSRFEFESSASLAIRLFYDNLMRVVWHPRRTFFIETELVEHVFDIFNQVL